MPHVAVTPKEKKVIGRLDSIRYYSEDSHWFVGRMDTGLIVTGTIFEPEIGKEYELTGKMVDSKYGEQFKFKQCVGITPTTDEGIRHYIKSKGKGIGSKISRLMMEKYGKDVLSILKDDPDRVAAEIKGITIERALVIQKVMLDGQDEENATFAMNELVLDVPGLTTKIIAYFMNIYRGDAMKRIQDNPYRLMEVKGVGFKTADKAAVYLGFPLAHVKRQANAILHALSESANGGGHTWVPFHTMTRNARILINNSIGTGLAHLMFEGWIEITPDGKYVALTRLAEAERIVAGTIMKLMKKIAPGTEVTLLDDLEPDQRAAIEKLTQHPVGILSGPPGTGKTYTLVRFVMSIIRSGYEIEDIVFCAPTGKAALRMTENLQPHFRNVVATTIHKLIGLIPGEDGVEEVCCKVVIVDETSMVDIVLMAKLCEAIRGNKDLRILLVGDPNQLPSVGPGCVIHDMIDAGVPHAELTTIKRNKGRIVRACHQIKDGLEVEWAPKFLESDGENFVHIQADSPDDIIEAVLRTVTKVAPSLNLDPVWDTQVISATNEKGDVSCKAINKALGDVLNPGEVGKIGFRTHDKVVRTKNGQTESGHLVVNGDLGVVVADTGKMVTVNFRNPDRRVEISKGEHYLQRAYCMTCHKMQGSEAPIIIIPLHKSFGTRITTREWIYTAISRAKRVCVTIGDKSMVRGMVGRRAGRRSTRLQEAFYDA